MTFNFIVNMHSSYFCNVLFMAELALELYSLKVQFVWRTANLGPLINNCSGCNCAVFMSCTIDFLFNVYLLLYA